MHTIIKSPANTIIHKPDTAFYYKGMLAYKSTLKAATCTCIIIAITTGQDCHHYCHNNKTTQDFC